MTRGRAQGGHRARGGRARPAALLTGAACLLVTSAALAGSLGLAAGRHSGSGRSPGGPARRPAGLAARRAPLPPVVPEPARMTAGRGWYALTPRTQIAVSPASGPALAVAADLAGYLRPATGYPLPVTAASPRRGDIAMVLGGRTAPRPGPDGEAYELTAAPSGARLAAGTAHGLYDAVQTFRQLLSPWIDGRQRRPGPWSLPAVRISDHPRYAYRGLMLDIARHYEPPGAVEALIGQAAAYKINVLHLHLSDDQGFRLAVRGFSRLARIGGRGSVGTGGRARDRGGYWTARQYRAVVADAAAHFITVVPEVDSPGHSNAIIMSEYADTANPRLGGGPQGIDCGRDRPPSWDYSQDVGYSALCPGSSATWVLMRAITGQLAAESPGPYYDIGGDEVPSALLSPAGYARFVSREARIVRARHKTVMGWADIAAPGTSLPPGSVAEYWQPAAGTAAAAVTAREAARKDMKLVMAPANHAYLDQKYRAGTRGDVPAGLGQSWACPDGCDVASAYDWDPGSLVSGVPGGSVIGVEGVVWTETLPGLAQVDYMTFPRLLALAEVAWSPAARRSPGSPAYRGFLGRLAAQGGRLMAAGVSFYPSAQVRWRLEAAGSALTAGPGRRVSGELATVAAPGFLPGQVSAVIRWGDGTGSRAVVRGRPPSGTSAGGLYAVAAAHSYARAGSYHGTVTLRAPRRAPLTVSFTVSAP